MIADQPLEAETLLQLYVLLAAAADPVRRLSNVYTRIQQARLATAYDRKVQQFGMLPLVPSPPTDSAPAATPSRPALSLVLLQLDKAAKRYRRDVY